MVVLEGNDHGTSGASLLQLAVPRTSHTSSKFAARCSSMLRWGRRAVISLWAWHASLRLLRLVLWCVLVVVFADRNSRQLLALAYICAIRSRLETLLVSEKTRFVGTKPPLPRRTSSASSARIGTSVVHDKTAPI